jgi:hypothetical protein
MQLGRQHRAMRVDLRRSRHTTLNILGMPLLANLEKNDPDAARELKSSLDRLLSSVEPIEDE